MRADWSVKLLVEDWANWSTKRKPKSRRMEGLFISIIMTVFQEREGDSERVYKKRRLSLEINYKVLSGFYKRISVLRGNLLKGNDDMSWSCGFFPLKHLEV
jgi:hypothetical protein